MNKEFCSCGCGLDPKHELGTKECFRKIAVGNLIPVNFRYRGMIDICTVNGATITVFTLKQQRGYSKHESGRWSLPKDESSINSLPDET